MRRHIDPQIQNSRHPTTPRWLSRRSGGCSERQSPPCTEGRSGGKAYSVTTISSRTSSAEKRNSGSRSRYFAGGSSPCKRSRIFTAPPPAPLWGADGSTPRLAAEGGRTDPPAGKRSRGDKRGGSKKCRPPFGKKSFVVLGITGRLHSGIGGRLRPEYARPGPRYRSADAIEKVIVIWVSSSANPSIRSSLPRVDPRQ
jgi:hypothetical protein